MRIYERDDSKVLYYALENGKTLIVQPHGSPICGQCSMAMVAGVTAREIVDQLYDERGTTAQERDALLAKYVAEVRTVFGIDNRKAIDLSGKGVLSVQFGRKRTGHALAFEDGEIYDPAGRHYRNVAEMKSHYKERGKKIRVNAITYATPHAEVLPELMAAQD